jgi:hypothetical protein
MLKFINKKGEKVLEVKDSGDISFVAEELKKKGLKETVEEKKKDKEEDK